MLHDMEVYTNCVILYGSDNMLPVVIVMDPDGSSEPYMIVKIKMMDVPFYLKNSNCVQL